MILPAASAPALLPIAAVERDTGLSKDTLRVWERRYGFPRPERSSIGDRRYPVEQVDRLRLLKRLLDNGMRPGHVVPLPPAELERLNDSVTAKAGNASATAEPSLRRCLALLKAHDSDALRAQLRRMQAQLGLAGFVIEVLAPLTTLVGDAWMQGEIEVHEEHLYTDQVGFVLREAIRSVPRAAPADRPRVLLTTLPGESHGLGLLMAEAIFTLYGAACVPLGTQTPLRDITAAAAAHRADIVALSVTPAMNPNLALAGLAELRAMLLPDTELWAGGAAPVLHRRPIDGVSTFSALPPIQVAVERWRLRVAA